VKRYGLIGFPLGHSFSQRFFTEKFARERLTDRQYDNFPLGSIEELPGLIAAHADLAGFNVTIPYKKAILPCLDTIDPQAAAIGAVNCVKVDRSGAAPRLVGYNTDVFGFRQSLEEMLGGRRPDALILGTGGASRAVEYVLDRLGIDWRKISRHASPGILSYDELSDEVLCGSPLIVNTTPLGTFPDVNSRPPLRYEAIGHGHFLHDLVYNPSETAFLHEGRRRGATVKNGWQMLVAQAERSWQIWNYDSEIR
jgi:shikimate dehydrogenase